jgi:hypothetical protein
MSTQELIDWLDRLINFQGVDPNEIRPHANEIRARLLAADEMAAELPYCIEWIAEDSINRGMNFSVILADAKEALSHYQLACK